MTTMPLGRLLVVDDEDAQMKALCRTLQAEGYLVSGFNSARQALAALHAGEFDLLLTDLMMPEMDGIALLHAARQIDGDLGGVVMTGHGTLDTAMKAMQVGALDYVLKPFRLNVILSVIARALDVRRLRLENARLLERERLHVAELHAANQELEAFAYSVSHDLRAPLRHIGGYADLLQEMLGTGLREDARAMLETIMNATRKMDALIVALLEFSRTGRAQMASGPVDLNQVVDEALELIDADLKDRTIDWQRTALPTVRADAALLRQVFVNLLSNAVKYTRPRRRALIEIGSRPEGDAVTVFVRDNGVGFDMRHAGNLFGVFRRMHREDEFEGTGIGLANAHRIVTRHGGRIWAEAAVDRGATFYFTLPR